MRKQIKKKESVRNKKSRIINVRWKKEKIEKEKIRETVRKELTELEMERMNKIK